MQFYEDYVQYSFQTETKIKTKTKPVGRQHRKSIKRKRISEILLIF